MEKRESRTEKEMTAAHTGARATVLDPSRTLLLLSDPPRMDKDRNETSRSTLDLTLEIIYLLTNEDYTKVKKTLGDSVTPNIHLHEQWSGFQRLVTKPPPHSLIHEQKILELTSRITELLSGEVSAAGNAGTLYNNTREVSGG
ncbi:oocyte zinc finger protein XlCOF29-like [Engystomops pustulosus]|uniref:oocyte zinc finger protein XlCOF29-like n=1 Tax=Engystomops pustulosus TaxID=76066 RepID=UPI003AFB6093